MNANIALFDIDGVVYEGHTIFDIIQDQEKTGFIKNGLWTQVLADLKEYKNGDKTYKEAADSMLSNYAFYLKGKQYKDVFNYNLKFFNQQKDKFFDYFPELLKGLQKTYDVYFVTTNYQFTTEAVSRILGVRQYLSSEIEVKNGFITGRLKKSLAGNKNIALQMLSTNKYNKSIAVGDSENDINMLKLVNNPVAFEPDEKLKVHARDNNWLILDRSTAYQEILNLV